MQTPTLIVIVGPTAVGKTALALELAKKFKTEIISADSRQIYREMDIGTAKPSALELSAVKHHFINSHSVQQEFNASDFGDQALQVCDRLFLNHKVIVVCGGSGLYVKGLLEGFDDIPSVEEGIRDKIVENYETLGLQWLQQQVMEMDAVYFEQVDQQNPQRLMRALEVMQSTGKPFSYWRRQQKKKLPFGVVKIGMEMDREQLYERIDKRMDKMIEAGLFDEAERLYPLRHLNALQTVGYQEIFDWMDGSYSREEAVRLMKRNTRHYAKRQLTWFKRDKEISWFSSQDSALEFLTQIMR